MGGLDLIQVDLFGRAAGHRAPPGSQDPLQTRARRAVLDSCKAVPPGRGTSRAGRQRGRGEGPDSDPSLPATRRFPACEERLALRGPDRQDRDHRRVGPAGQRQGRGAGHGRAWGTSRGSRSASNSPPGLDEGFVGSAESRVDDVVEIRSARGWAGGTLTRLVSCWSSARSRTSRSRSCRRWVNAGNRSPGAASWSRSCGLDQDLRFLANLSLKNGWTARAAGPRRPDGGQGARPQL
jgi:hypothetical protein